MKSKKTFKALWNVFLFVISGGSLIYGMVQHRRATEARIELKEYEVRLDSVKAALKTKNAELERALKGN